MAERPFASVMHERPVSVSEAILPSPFDPTARDAYFDWAWQAMPQGAVLLDGATAEPRVMRSNRGFQRMFGTGQAEHALGDLLGVDVDAPAWQSLCAAIRRGEAATWEGQAYLAELEPIRAQLTAYPVAAPPGQCWAMALITDGSEAWNERRARQRAEQRLEVLLPEMSEALIRADIALVLNSMNAAAEALTAWSAAAAVGRPVGDVVQLFDATTDQPLGDPLLRALLTGQESGWQEGARLRRTDGAWVPVSHCTRVLRDDDGSILEALLLLRPHAGWLMRSLGDLARRDAATELPHRSVFDDRLDQALALASRHGHGCGLLLVDVADLDKLAAQQGMYAADQLMHRIGQGLQAAFRRSDTVCRIGDTRFAVVLPLVNEKATAALLAAKACAAAPEREADMPDMPATPIRLRVGVALYPGDARTAPQLEALAADQLQR